MPPQPPRGTLLLEVWGGFRCAHLGGGQVCPLQKGQACPLGKGQVCPLGKGQVCPLGRGSGVPTGEGSGVPISGPLAGPSVICNPFPTAPEQCVNLRPSELLSNVI